MINCLMHWLRRGFLILLLFMGPSLQADIVYPARLQLTETAPGVYEVFFVLPVIQGKILRAQAVFPEFCTSNSEPVTEVDSYQKKMRWQIACGENTLAGQQIGIDGLLGSQVDIILEINTLDGRIFESTLSPAQAYYTIPEAPEFRDYIQIGTFPAGRFVLLQWGLVLLVLLYFLIWRNPDFRLLLITLSGGLALGFFLDHKEWLLVPSWAATTLPLGVAAVISLGAFIKKHTQEPDHCQNPYWNLRGAGRGGIYGRGDPGRIYLSRIGYPPWVFLSWISAWHLAPYQYRASDLPCAGRLSGRLQTHAYPFILRAGPGDIPVANEFILGGTLHASSHSPIDPQ